MKQNKLFKLWLLAVILFACSGMTWGTTVNYAMTSLGLDNGIATGTGSYTVDAVISISFEKNNAGTVPTYYSADGVRLYQHATKGGSMKISVANGYKITDVVVTRAGTSGDGPAGYSIDNTTEAGTFANNTVTNSINSINATSYVEYYSKGTSSTTRTYIASIAVTYTSSSSTPTVATPTFSPGTGNYLTTQNVTITTLTEGATIRYTTNGAEPTESSTEYTTPIAVSSTTTLIAKAFKAGMDASAVATATYSFPVQVANIAGFLATSETGNVAISGPVTVVYQNGQNLYVQDASGSLLVYGSTGKTFVNGDQLTGLMGIRGVYEGSPQMTNPVAPDATSGSAVSPLSFDLSGVTTLDLAKYVKVDNVQFTADVTFSTTSTVNGTLVAPAGFTVRDNFRLGGSVLAAKNYDIIGFISYYNGTAQLFPVSITEVATTTPIIIATPTTISLSAEIGDPDVSQDITVTGSNLTADINAVISGTDAAQFSLSSATLPQAGETLTVTYTPSAAEATHTATLTLSSTGADDVIVTLNGETTFPPLVAPVAEPASSLSQTGFTANWNAVSGAESYKLNVYTKTDGGNASDLFISEYIEGSSFNKAIEIFNGTGSVVDLSSYSIMKQVNGAGEYGSELTLSGTLANNDVYVIAYFSDTSAASSDILAVTDLQTNSSAINYNGNDAVALFKNSVKIDEVGVFNQVTPNWGTDLTLVRKSTTVSPKATYDAEDWDVYEKDYVTNLGSHTMNSSSKTPITGSPFTTTSTSQAVSGLVNTGIYFYTVTAVRGTEESPLSNEIGPISLTATGLSNAKVDALAWTSSGKVMLNASAGEVIEIFNVAGQKVVSRPAVDGLNSVDVSAKGVVIVKVNNRISKVIL